ncbi:Hypothetical predicted protein, partial [Olea europaea subsp. europaea]
QKRQHDASTSGVQIPPSVSTVITSVPLPTGTSSHAQTQPSAPSVTTPVNTALPVISASGPAISTSPLATVQVTSLPITLIYNPMLDEILKRPQIQDYPIDTVSRASYIPGPTPRRGQTQPPAPSMAPPITTALPVINTVDPVTSTPHSAPVQVINPPITPFYDPTLDEILKRPQIQNSPTNIINRASFIPSLML